MPTGYTAAVQDGEIRTFEQFARRCVRAMGVFVRMRDDPMDAPLPKRLKVEPYHRNALKKAEKKLAALLAKTPSQRRAAAKRACAAELRRWRRRDAERSLHANRYADMLKQVRAWRPPSRAHAGFKKFMIDQLVESIRFDCSPDTQPAELSTEEWFAKALEDARWDVKYHKDELKKEREGVASSNKWLSQFYGSLKVRP